MRVTMIGTGYVGLVSGACFADFGHDVCCIDKDAGKIERLKKGEIPIFEPGLEDLVARNVRAGRLSFSVEAAEAIRAADAVFIAVGTPTRRGDGHADLSYVYAAAEEIAGLIKEGREIRVVDAKTNEDLTKSTLALIIMEGERHKKNLLPLSFMYQLIKYGESIQDVFQEYLSAGFEAFLASQQEAQKRLREWD